MSDLKKYTQTRASRDPEFADGLEAGYTNFKVGAAHDLELSRVPSILKNPIVDIGKRQRAADERQNE